MRHQFGLSMDPFLARDVQTQDFVAIDENRNGLIVQLSRDLGDVLTIEARYAIYSNEFATKACFLSPAGGISTGLEKMFTRPTSRRDFGAGLVLPALATVGH